MCDGTTQGQARCRKKARRGEKHQQGSRTPRCVDERSDDSESGGIVVGGWHENSGDDSMSSHDSDFELTNEEEDEEEDEEGPQGEEGPQPRGGARESLPPRASAAAAADHQSNNNPAALLRRSTRVLPIATYAPPQRARPKGTTPGGPGRGKTKMTTWARMVMKGSKRARREARLENTKEQREKRRSAEEKRAARAAALRERKKIDTEARAALLQPVHQLKLDTIVEHPEEALSTDSKKGQAYRQAYAILFFVSLELIDGFYTMEHSRLAAIGAGVTDRVVRSWCREFVANRGFKTRVG